MTHQVRCPASARVGAWVTLAMVTALTALAVLAGWQAARPAAAHVRSTEGTSVIRQDGAAVRYDLSLEYDVLAAAAGLGQPAEAGDLGKERLLAARQDRVSGYLVDRVAVSLDGVACTGRLERTGVERRDDVVYARGRLVYDCPTGSSPGGYTVRYGVFADGAVVDDHRNIADYRLGPASGTYVFDSGHHELDAGRPGVRWAAAGRFVFLGVEHILSGLDHLLFLAVLLIGARGLRSVVKLATSFTAAHSVTLGLGGLGWVHAPAQVVEPLIALSIAYIAAENIVGGESRHRPLVVFGFGLLHGLGFAGTLSFTGEIGGRLLLSLLSFNIGIELGQALVIGLLFPLLLLLRRRFAWSAAAHTGGTAMAGTFGLVWFFQRLVL